MKQFIKTISGKLINVAAPSPNDITIEDIAHALSKECRYANQINFHYSVAQHSVLCAELPMAALATDRLCLLLHDAPEAYLRNIPAPVKELLPQYKALEELFMQVICIKFKLPYPLPQKIKSIDKQIFDLEYKQFIENNPTNNQTLITCWNQKQAYNLFMDHYNRYTHLTTYFVATNNPIN